MAKKTATRPERPAPPASLAEFRRRISPHLKTIRIWSDASQERAKRIRAYHRIGCELRLVSPTYSRDLLYEATGHGRSWQREVEQFANQYSKHELNELCAQAENVITGGHLRLVLFLPPKKRESWLSMSYRRRWTADRLRRELKRQGVLDGSGGSRGGRPMGGSRTQPAFRLEKLARLTDDWVGIGRDLLNDHHQDDPALAELDGCNAAFWKRLQVAMDAAVDFQKKCEGLRDELDHTIAAVVIERK